MRFRLVFTNKGGQGWELSTGAGRTDSFGPRNGNMGELRGNEEWQTLKAVQEEDTQAGHNSPV